MSKIEIMTDKEYMKVGIVVFKVALTSFSLGIIVGLLIFK